MNTKDSIANAVSFTGVGVATFGNIESILTILLLLTGIALNVMRMRDRKSK